MRPGIRSGGIRKLAQDTRTNIPLSSTKHLYLYQHLYRQNYVLVYAIKSISDFRH